MAKLAALRKSRYLVVLATAALLAVLVTACGGDDSSSSETGRTSTESGTSSGSEGGVSSSVAEFVEAVEQEPEFAIKKALPSKPDPDENVFCLKNEVAQSQVICNGVRAASEAVGFNYQERSYEAADASALVILMKEILRDNPDVVIFGGDPEAIWGQVKPTYEKAGVSLVPIFVGPAELDEVSLGNVAGPSTQEKAAKMSADWFIADSGGKGKAIIQTVPGFPVIAEWQGYFEEEVAKECPDCAVESVEASLEELGSGAAVQALVSALQRDSEIGYAIAYNTNFVVGIANELKNAGISDVKIGGFAGTAEAVTDILNGEDYGWVLFNQEYTGWEAVDFYLNHLAGVELTPEEEVMPLQLITSKNATKEIAETANEYALPSDYREQFEKLWGVG